MEKRNFLLKFWPDLCEDTSNFTLFISAICDGVAVSAPEIAISPQGEVWVIVSNFMINSEKSGSQWADFLEFRVAPYDDNSVSFWVKNKTEEYLRIDVQEIKWEGLFKKVLGYPHALFFENEILNTLYSFCDSISHSFIKSWWNYMFTVRIFYNWS